MPAGETGANVTNVRAADAGLLLADTITALLGRWSFVPDGLKEVQRAAPNSPLMVAQLIPLSEWLKKPIFLHIHLSKYLSKRVEGGMMS